MIGRRGARRSRSSRAPPAARPASASETDRGRRVRRAGPEAWRRSVRCGLRSSRRWRRRTRRPRPSPPPRSGRTRRLPSRPGRQPATSWAERRPSAVSGHPTTGSARRAAPSPEADTHNMVGSPGIPGARLRPFVTIDHHVDTSDLQDLEQLVPGPLREGRLHTQIAARTVASGQLRTPSPRAAISDRGRRTDHPLPCRCRK